MLELAFPEGVFGFIKPKGPSSNRFLTSLKKVIGRKIKIGHAGTLDPLASGVLVVGIGRGTKLLSGEIIKDKEYLADITLGKESSTDDEEGVKTVFKVDRLPDLNEVETAVRSFIGETEQRPPIYSALKISGIPAYKLARKGVVVDLKPRKAIIYDIKIISYSYPTLKIRVVCGSGVYIRSLAKDIGQALKTGAYLSDLKRTRVGHYLIEESLSLDEFAGRLEQGL